MENKTKRTKVESPHDTVRGNSHAIFNNANEPRTPSHFDNSKNLTPKKDIKYSNKHPKTPENTIRVNIDSKFPYLPNNFEILRESNIVGLIHNFTNNMKS